MVIRHTGLQMGDKMKIKFTPLAILLFSAGCSAVQTNALPADVEAFQNNAEDCQHFAGEWDSYWLKSEQEQIEASVDKYCGAARKQQKQLQKKYPGDKQVQEITAEYDL